jgi:hypothetical protein
MLASVHRRPPPSANCANTIRVNIGERPRTGMNETKTEPMPGLGSGVAAESLDGSSAACVVVTGRMQRFVLHAIPTAPIADYLRAQVPGRRCLHCTQICHLCTCLNWLPMTCAGRSRVRGRGRRWRALPCWDPRGGLAWRRLGCYQPAGWRRCGLAPSRRGVRWPGRRGSWVMSVVQTTALDRNSGMSAAARRSGAAGGTSGAGV